ncbi:MAG TPA: hypothetical protein VG963_06370, partial [Polyangiaceae bacterium]|nr:hypothetical protein [Polyangiaceae bacterium]
EHVADLRGKLEDDLLRIRDILDRATPASLLIINELFSSTSHDDALYLGREILERIFAQDLICVYVTFLDELAAPHHRTVSLVAGVDARDPSRRTFRVERRSADGLAHALALAEKHRVSYRALKERIPECDRS